MKVFRNLFVVAAAGAALTIAAQARADTISFFLSTVEGSGTTTPTSGGTTAPSPQVEVTVSTWTTSAYSVLATGSSDFATVVFSTTAANFPAPVGINVNGNGNKTTGNFFATSSNGLAGGSGACGVGQSFTCVGGGTSHAGSFDLETAGGSDTSITFDLTSTIGWANAAAVLLANSDGWEAADNMSNSPQDLGVYVSTGQFSSTPLPATLPLFATTLGGLGLLGWRRKRKAQALAA
jgi:hypothetical protein